MNLETDLINYLTQKFLVTDRAYLQLMCTHLPAVNKKMKAPVRVGKGLLEFNPVLLEGLKMPEIINLFKVELVRLALKHPYSRRPYNCIPISLTLGSDFSISRDYGDLNNKIKKPTIMQLPEGESYEWYAYKITRLLNMPQDPNAAPQLSPEELQALEEISLNWEEDELQQQEINRVIANLSDEDWGSIPGNLKEEILATLKPKLDYRNILRSFHASVISSKRHLTRMKPSRRKGWEQMGSKYDLSSNILVAVDTSGSISDDELQIFMSAVNRFFKYGIENLDLITFDSELQNEMTFKKAKTKIKVSGRGGTNFQVPIDYITNSKTRYDGLIIFTDGFAPPPVLTKKFPARILWVFTNEQTYAACHQELQKTKARTKCCYIKGAKNA